MKNSLNRVIIPIVALGVVSTAFFTKKAVDSQRNYYNNDRLASQSIYEKYYDTYNKNSFDDYLLTLSKDSLNSDLSFATINNGSLEGKIKETFNTTGEGSGSIKDVNSYNNLKEEFAKNNLDINDLKFDANGRMIYIIRKDDTLTYLSRLFGYSVDKIANLNEIRDVNLIYEGSSLQIPNEQYSNNEN